MIAQAASSLDSVPAEFIKYFLIVATFLAGNWLMLRKAGGRAQDPLHLKTPIETKRSPIYADKVEIEHRLSKFEMRLEKIEADTSLKFAQILQAAHDRELRITTELHKMRDDILTRIDSNLQQAYHRMNDTDRHVAALEGKANIRPRTKD